MFTNGDNLYGQKMIDEFVLPLMQEGVDIFGFDFISHYKWFVILVYVDPVRSQKGRWNDNKRFWNTYASRCRI
jgi:hypothetical protein